MALSIIDTRIAKASINDLGAGLAVEAGGTNTFKVSVGKRSAGGSILARLRVAEITLGQDRGVHISSGALEQVGGAGEQELVLHQGWHGALGNPRLYIVSLDPL